MTHEQMMKALEAAADPSYAAYQRKIVCDTGYPLIFVRMPALRKIAREVSRGEWRAAAGGCVCSCYEEVLTVSLGIAGAEADLRDRLDALEPMLTMLDSWAMTDSIVPTLGVKTSERAVAWDFAVSCIHSDGEYIRRFGIVMLLNYFLIPEYLEDVVTVILSIRDQRYYVRMACAWLLAEMAVQDWNRVNAVLADGQLDAFVHNMTIRKIRESLRISGEVKAAASAMKRKDD